MSYFPRYLWSPIALVLALGVSGCTSQEPAPPTAVEASASAPANSSSAAAEPAESSPSASSAPTGSAAPPAQVELAQTFTSPEGSLSFRYPAGWTVEVLSDSPEELRQWALRDAEGVQVLLLTVRPDQDMYKVSPPLTPIVIPQGQIPGVVDQLGTATVAAVAASPGQSVGGTASVLYGLTSATGADPVFGDVRWGEGSLLSFSGYHQLGPNDEVDMAAGAEEFAASTQFRTQILPILQSLTVTANPGAPVGAADDQQTPAAPGPAAEATCAGVQYTYENLHGITCQEAKAILQVVSDTGEPIGARGQHTEEYHCFWSSDGEQEAGLADVICRHRVDGSALFEANYS